MQHALQNEQCDETMADEQRARSLLHEAAITLLTGNNRYDDVLLKQLPSDLPVHARRIIADLRQPGDSLPLSSLKEAVELPARITLRGKARVLALCVALFGAPFAVSSLVEDTPFGDPGLMIETHEGHLGGLIDYYQQLEKREDDKTLDYARYKRAIEFTVHSFYPEDPRFPHHSEYSRLTTPEDRATYEDILNREKPDLSNYEVVRRMNAIGAEGVDASVWTKDQYQIDYVPIPNWFESWIESYLFELLLAVTLLCAVPSMFLAMVMREPPLLRLLGVSIVTTEGERASRLRAFIRSMVLWVLVLGPFWAIVGAPAWDGVPDWAIDGLKEVWPSMLTAWVVFMAVAFAVYMFVARRGLHDRLTRTLLVPR
jgi:hypothetical protein